MIFIHIREALSQPRQKKQRHGGTVIYALVDPRDSLVRYVGKTRTSLVRRLDLHLRQPTNREMAGWFSGLKGLRRRPEIVALEYVDDSEWEDAERGWIYWFRARGDLLNVDPGGQYRTPTGRVRGVVMGEFSPPLRVTETLQAASSPKEPTRRRWRSKLSVWDRVHLPMGRK